MRNSIYHANFCQILVLKCSLEYCAKHVTASVFDVHVVSLLIYAPKWIRLVLQPDSAEVRTDRQAALHHIQRRKQLQTSGLSMNQNRFAVVDKSESGWRFEKVEVKHWRLGNMYCLHNDGHLTPTSDFKLLLLKILVQQQKELSICVLVSKERIQKVVYKDKTWCPTVKCLPIILM